MYLLFSIVPGDKNNSVPHYRLTDLTRRLRVFIPLSLVILGSLLAIPQPRVQAATIGPTAAFRYEPCLLCLVVGNVAFFDANASRSPSATIVSYTWNFGDGTPPTTVTSPSIAHDFGTTVSDVTLTVTDSAGQTDTITQHFVWNLVPRFTIQPNQTGVNQPVLFNATSSKSYASTVPITGYDWTFGDDTSGSGVLVKHAYLFQGLFRVSLTLLTGGNPIGNPEISRTIQVGPITGGQQLVNTIFDDANVTVVGFFIVNSTAKILDGQARVTVTNATTGALLFSQTFTVSFSYRFSTMVRFVLVASINPYKLGVTCSTDPSSNSTSCFVSRNPDVAGTGTVGVIDYGMLAVRFGAPKGSPKYLPAVDLANRGIIDIVDAGIMGTDFGVPLYQ